MYCEATKCFKGQCLVLQKPRREAKELQSEAAKPEFKNPILVALSSLWMANPHKLQHVGAV